MARRTISRSKPSRGSASSAAPDVRDRIIDRTVHLMARLGTTDVSVRAIAREAGVNVAAVNYYFSSKEQMLAQMAANFTRGFEEVMRLLEGSDDPPEKRLRRWAAEVMRFLAEYPGILALMERQISAEPVDAFGQVLRTSMQRAARSLKNVLREIAVGDDASRLAFKLTLFASTLAGPFPRSLDPGARRSGMRTAAQRGRFLDLLLEHLRK